jgi:N-acetylmuramoyl-L-alanine amidase
MRTNVSWTALVVVAVLLVVAGGAWALYALDRGSHAKAPVVSSAGPLPSSSIASADGSGPVAATGLSGTASSGVDVEVPSLVGKSVKVAEALVTGAGLTVQTRVADPLVPGAQPNTVVSQWPAAQALVPQSSDVVITYQPAAGSATTTSTFIVVIDPGHQQKANVELEPIGPGSSQKKEKVGLGVTGVATGLPEYAQALAISLKLRDMLVSQGVQVVMVRTTNGVDIPNSVRAGIGNSAQADLVVRVHLSSSTDVSIAGIAILYPAGNKWVAGISARSLKAAQSVLSAVVGAAGAPSRGVFGKADQSGFNYSSRPVVLVECGLVSNATEDRLIATEAYQQKLAGGIAVGVMNYLRIR